MGPTILLDKSAFQALSSTEMHTVTKYFQWNRVDILLHEIICNFLKKSKPEALRNKASILADKFSLINSVHNMNYIELCIANLHGHDVLMDGRPIVKPTSISALDNGQRTAFIDETQFGEMIHRWQRGEFNVQDKELANSWKEIKDNSKADDCLKVMEANRIIIPTAKSINELMSVVNEYLRNPKMQDVFLDIFLSYQIVNPAEKKIIQKKLRQSRYSLPKIAPYAFYCLKVFVLFFGAYKFDLLPEKKADDQIDLEYLFYLPFCNVFSSNDRFHGSLAPALLRKDQHFLSGEDLKKGIKEIGDSPSYEETLNAKCWPIPPMPKESIIRKAWIQTKWLYA